jgi:hypothetical protein
MAWLVGLLVEGFEIKLKGSITITSYSARRMQSPGPMPAVFLHLTGMPYIFRCVYTFFFCIRLKTFLFMQNYNSLVC